MEHACISCATRRGSKPPADDSATAPAADPVNPSAREPRRRHHGWPAQASATGPEYSRSRPRSFLARQDSDPSGNTGMLHPHKLSRL
jgi:hypothetical protein